MGNRRAREFALKSAGDDAWNKARLTPRLATEDIVATKIGLRRLQLIILPSFEDAAALEIRQAGDEFRLFVSRVSKAWPSVELVGYDWIEADSGVLASFFNRIVGLCLPLSPDLTGGFGIDGTSFHLAVFGDYYSEWRFQWWSHSPAQWKPLVDVAEEMLHLFLESQLKAPSPAP